MYQTFLKFHFIFTLTSVENGASLVNCSSHLHTIATIVLQIETKILALFRYEEKYFMRSMLQFINKCHS